MTASPPDACDPRSRAIRAELGRGDRLPDRLRDALERASGTNLGAVRLHADETAHGLAASLRAEAFTTGADVFFGADSLRPESRSGLELLAHEVAHVAQQACSGLPLGGQMAEREAIAFARAFAASQVPVRRHRHEARPVSDADALVVQCHSSWEHRLLGDLLTTDFGTISAGGGNRKAYLQRVQKFLWMWQSNPNVSADRITKEFPEIRPLRLRGSGLVVTYGELNTLADYVASPAALDAMPSQALLPILQQVRQEGYAWVTWVIEDTWLDKLVYSGRFDGSVQATSGSDTADTLFETGNLETHTLDFGPRGTDHYKGLLARNACHFAPHSWYRWEQFYLQARAFALEAHHATGDRKERLTNLAWIHHGYADHFLHDSFAAGHLINKTLVMQWYLDWATFTPGPDWDLVQFMTLDRQPDLSGRPLYSAFDNPAARGDVRDPQTAGEHWSQARRMAVSGVRADAGSVADSYKRWLAFLSSGVVQLASNAVHDAMNSSSLWVSSQSHPTAYQIYGDNTMIQGGDGYQIASATAQLSQKSISEVLAQGTTTVNTGGIAAQFPSRVHADPQAPSQTLEQWAYGYQAQAGKLFGGVKNVGVGALRFRLEPVNIDHTGGWVWERVPGMAVSIAVGGDSVVWSIDARLDDLGNGLVQSWDPTASSWTPRNLQGRKIAADGAGVVWVLNQAGAAYRKAPGSDVWQQVQPSSVGGGIPLSDIAAGTDGSVWALTRTIGAGDNQLMRWIEDGTTQAWEPVHGGGTVVSVGPDGLPWLVTSDGRVVTLKPGTGPDRYNADDAAWIDVSPEQGDDGRPRASDVALGTGSLLRAWFSTGYEGKVYGWNGRLPNQPTTPDRIVVDWEDVQAEGGTFRIGSGPAGDGAFRIAAGPDGMPWVTGARSAIFRLVAGATPTANFATTDAGKVTGTARATSGSLFQGESVSINGNTDLSHVIVGNSGARVYSIRLDRSSLPGVNYRLSIDGQGPSGAGSGSMYIYIEDEGGFTEYKGFLLSARQSLTIDYDGSKAGIKRISWSDGNDPG